MAFTYKWPRPTVTVDIAVIAKNTIKEQTKLLLIKRKHDPYKDHWALPGGFVDENEPLEKAALRELQEETLVEPKHVDLVQIGAYGEPGRDPRGWCVTVLYSSFVESTNIHMKAADDAAEAEWLDVRQLPKLLAFDHKILLRDAFHRMVSLLPEGSTSEDLRSSLQSESLSGN